MKYTIYNGIAILVAMFLLAVMAYQRGFENGENKMQEEAIKYGHGYMECSVDGTIKFFVWRFDVPETKFVVPEFPRIKDDELDVSL